MRVGGFFILSSQSFRFKEKFLTFLIFYAGDRLRNLTIKFARSNGDFLERASFLGPATNGSYHVFEIDNFIGRYVKLTSWESYAILTLCEVQVWARDISKGKTMRWTLVLLMLHMQLMRFEFTAISNRHFKVIQISLY